MAFVRIALLSGLLACCCCLAVEDSLRVPTSTGILYGRRLRVLHRELRLFLGVPYAEAPVGGLRFKPPVELFSEGIEKQANRFAPSCYQPPHLASVISPLLEPNRAEISEDCLYLNVYDPERKEGDAPLPVMVWLPGEGFDYADPQQFDGSYLAVQGKVVVITVNYRLSAFGFLSVLNEEAPGNVGLLDQRMALRWVKKNIGRFGGDPENVTLFGRFTGSMSAAIHAFSPLGKREPLFQRVILQSGVPVGEWVFDRNPLNSTLQLAAATDCLFSSLSDVIACLRRLPSDILLNSAMALPQRFRPVYDYHLVYENTLKSVSKSEYRPLDVMVGTNNDEGTLCTIALKAMQSPLYHKILQQSLTEADFSELVASNMLDTYKKRDPLSDRVVVYKYTSQHKASRLREMFVRFCGDLYVTSHSQQLSDLLAGWTSNNVYMYEFAHRPSFSIHPSFIKAGHGDDVLFTLGLPLKKNDLPEDEARLTRRIVEAISNFARSGNPNGANTSSPWPRYTLTGKQMMSFVTFRDNREPTVGSHEDASVFWHQIIPAIRQKSTCPFRPVSHSKVEVIRTQGPIEDSELRAVFLGSPLSVPVAEHLMQAMICTILILTVLAFASSLMLYKYKQRLTFQRLR